MNLSEASKTVNEISNNLKKKYLKAAIEDLEWFAGADEYHGLGPEQTKQWDKRRKSVLKLIDQLTSTK